MKLIVLGATGKTGRSVVEFALAQGHRVTAFVRSPDAISPRDGLSITEGSVEDEEAMVSCFSGHDALVSCLGVRVEARNLLRQTDFQRRSLPSVMAAINRAGVERFVLMSSLGIGGTARKQSLIPRLLAGTIAKRLYDDKAIAERRLSQCEANWKAVYPVSLRTGPADDNWNWCRSTQYARFQECRC